MTFVCYQYDLPHLFISIFFPGPPPASDFGITEVYPFDIRLSWSTADFNVRPPYITKYQLVYFIDGNKRTEFVDYPNTDALISDLNPDEVYEFQMTAYTTDEKVFSNTVTASSKTGMEMKVY